MPVLRHKFASRPCGTSPPSTMEAKLQALKVAELKELLHSAQLPTSGNKPDLVKRLLENPDATQTLQDASGDDKTAAPQKPAESTGQNITKPHAVSAPASEPSKASSNSTATSSTLPENKTTDTGQPSNAADSTAAQRKEDLLAELEKRKSRAIRFGQPYDDLEKQISRIHKFGIETNEANGVDRLESELNRSKATKSSGPKASVGGKGVKSIPSMDTSVDVREIGLLTAGGGTRA